MRENQGKDASRRSLAGVAGMIGSALMLAWLKNRPSGSSSSVPVKVTSTEVPALPPDGTTVKSRGLGNAEPS